MNSNGLEDAFDAALSRIDPTPALRHAKKYTPIFHRDSDATKKQAIRDAAAALAALWMPKGSKHSGAKYLSVRSQ